MNTKQTNENALMPADNLWNRQLGGFDEFQTAIDAFIDWANELQTKTLGEVFGSKTAPLSLFVLSILTRQHVGILAYKWDQYKARAIGENKEEYNEQTAICDFILNSLASKNA